MEIGLELRRVRDRATDASRQVGEVANQVSEMLPRLGDVEDGLAAVAGALEGAAGREDDESGPIALTPALRWSGLSEQEAVSGWEALGGWVATVLNSEYRLTRVELPDCWPVHPRAVRELAWLRTCHVAAAAPRTRPDVVAEWHVRWLPAALNNLAAAIDPRECAPGRHRLTEEERRLHEIDLGKAMSAGEAEPPVTSETGPDRPRYLPGRFPPRRSHDPDSYGRDTTTGPQSLDHETPAPPSSPEYWREYYLEARDADLLLRAQQR
ncbi:MAG: hypothetical protein L0I76_12685 [Pseudonocardia sp.]|nr:hypothetical protein [Pseudonocardia sp.]